MILWNNTWRMSKLGFQVQGHGSQWEKKWLDLYGSLHRPTHRGQAMGEFRIGAAPAVILLLYWSVVVKNEQSQKMKLSIFAVAPHSYTHLSS